MKYIEYKIYCSQDGLDSLIEQLCVAGYDQVIINDPREADIFDKPDEGYHWDFVDQAVLDELHSKPCITLYVNEGETLGEEAALLMKNYDVQASHVDDQDWLHKWEEYYVPVKISDKFVVKPVWKEYEPQGDEMIIDIDPGMAFGTGSSPTTYLTIRLMEKYVKPGDEALDVGCGTGILSIAAAKLGCSKATAIDLDPEAVRSTGENIKINGCQALVDVHLGDLVEGVDVKADAVLANLTTELLMRLSKDVAKHCKPGAVYLCSGIIDFKEELCARAIEEAGFEILEIIRDDCWSAIAARLK